MAWTPALINEQNPWPWLDPFGEDATRFFHGREDEIDALLRMVRGTPVMVLFGKSGLGKTSLLQAGLFPKLRTERFLPVYVRLRHEPQAGSLQEQIWSALAAQCDARKIVYAGASEQEAHAGGDLLWLYLHRRPLDLRDPTGAALQPVFVLDQFEEQFTLGAQDAVRQERLFAELGDLLENRVPHRVAALIEKDDGILDHHDLDVQGYKFVISLREDYLPDLEHWADEMPRLGPNRYRLLPMGRAQALDAISKTGGALVNADHANKIVDFLTSKDSMLALRRRGRHTADIQVEPALLSLVCSGLNAKRIETGLVQLNTDNLDRQGGEIIERFYDERLKPMPPSVHRLIERELITADGVRLQYPIQSATAQGNVTRDAIDQLVGQRILRKESSGETERIELVHDRLAAVALKRRREAEQREALAAQQAKAIDAEQLAAARSQARKYGWFATIAILVISVGTFLLYDAYRARSAAEMAALEVRFAMAEAQAQRDQALAAQRQAENALAQARRLDADNQRYEAAIKANPALAKSLNAPLAAKAIVYLQVARAEDGSAAVRLRKQLRDSGYDSPEIEKVAVAPKELELRYFRDADQGDAEALAELLKQWNYSPVQTKRVKGYETRSQLKQLEIWFPQARNAALARTAELLNSSNADERKKAIQSLWASYRASPEAIAEVLALYQAERINALNPNGMFNGVHFLSGTDPKAWNAALEASARAAIVEIENRNPGPNTRELVQKLRALLDSLKLGASK